MYLEILYSLNIKNYKIYTNRLFVIGYLISIIKLKSRILVLFVKEFKK